MRPFRPSSFPQRPPSTFTSPITSPDVRPRPIGALAPGQPLGFRPGFAPTRPGIGRPTSLGERPPGGIASNPNIRPFSSSQPLNQAHGALPTSGGMQRPVFRPASTAPLNPPAQVPQLNQQNSLSVSDHPMAPPTNLISSGGAKPRRVYPGMPQTQPSNQQQVNGINGFQSNAQAPSYEQSNFYNGQPQPNYSNQAINPIQSNQAFNQPPPDYNPQQTPAVANSNTYQPNPFPSMPNAGMQYGSQQQQPPFNAGVPVVNQLAGSFQSMGIAGSVQVLVTFT